MSIECPNCKASLSPVAVIPDEQVLYFTITNDGGPFSLKIIGATITNAERLMVATAKGCGEKVQVFLHSVEHEPGRFQFGMMIVNQTERAGQRGMRGWRQW
ncbi:MAG: hypothetical protein J5J04_17290 [Anaerolineae bacterium]|nr:hypothetical protein [Anaerolineae bacterium]